MWSKQILSSLVVTSALVSVGGIGQARADVIDNFDTAHDYRFDGFAGTVWDGILNASNASVIDANTTNTSQLTITTNGNTTQWEGTGQSGPLLYQDVTGDFVASVTVASGDANNFNVASLLARNPSAVSTADESFYAANYNFFGATPGVQRRNVNPGSTSKFDSTTVAVGTPTMLQIERTGDDFLASYSIDGGTNWIAMGSAITKSDMPDTIQIGLGAANYGANSFSVVFDDFSLVVPEPASLSLLALGTLAMMPRRRR